MSQSPFTLNTILTTMAFYNLEDYMEGISINFASPIQSDREAFVSDFIINFTYKDMYCAYCIVCNPQSDTRIINCISVHGHFLYQGNDFSQAMGKLADFYKILEKHNVLESGDFEDEDKEEKGIESNVIEFEIQKTVSDNQNDDDHNIDITKN